MEQKQYKSFPFEYKVDEDKGIFTGYASTFGNEDAGRDIIEPGAFKKTIKENIKRIKVLWQHMPWHPIGRPIKMEEDSKGLFTESKISMTTLGKDTFTLLKDKVITELSIGYETIKAEVDEENDSRILKEVRLWEYSPVTWAMNDEAVVLGAKSKDMEGMLFRLTDMLHTESHKMGSKDIKVVQDTINALQALLKVIEPGEPTPNNDPEPPDNDKDKNESHEHSLVDDVLGPLNELTSKLRNDKLVDDLKAFSKELRGGKDCGS